MLTPVVYTEDEVMFGPLLGSIIGLLFSKLMKLSHHKGLMDRESYIAQYLALALLTTGITSGLGVDDLLASFAAAPLRGTVTSKHKPKATHLHLSLTAF